MTTVVWRPADPAAQILRAQYTADFGQPYCCVVKLGVTGKEGNEGYLVYSPGRGLVESAQKFLPASAQLFLLAPSTGHSLGLQPWRAAFPSAQIVGSAIAAKRLGGKLSIGAIEQPDAIATILPKHISLHELPPNRFGEVWVRVEMDEAVYWLVCDTLMNLERLEGGFLVKRLMKWYGLGEGLHLHKLFTRGNINLAKAGAWMKERFSGHKRNILIPCHGEIYDRDDFVARIEELIQSQLR